MTATITITTADLSYDGASRTFTADASDLHIAPGTWPRTIAVLSVRTGGTRDFTQLGLDRDADNDVTAAVYRTPCGLTLRIFND